MPGKTPQSKIDRAHALYIEGMPAKLISERLHISERSINRYAQTLGWDAVRDAGAIVISEVVAEVMPAAFLRKSLQMTSGTLADHDLLIVDAITILSGSVATQEARSQETAALAMVKLIEAYRERNPETIEDLVERCVKLGFSSSDFFDRLDNKNPDSMDNIINRCLRLGIRSTSISAHLDEAWKALDSKP